MKFFDFIKNEDSELTNQFQSAISAHPKLSTCATIPQFKAHRTKDGKQIVVQSNVSTIDLDGFFLSLGYNAMHLNMMHCYDRASLIFYKEDWNSIIKSLTLRINDTAIRKLNRQPASPHQNTGRRQRKKKEETRCPGP